MHVCVWTNLCILFTPPCTHSLLCRWWYRRHAHNFSASAQKCFAFIIWLNFHIVRALFCRARKIENLQVLDMVALEYINSSLFFPSSTPVRSLFGLVYNFDNSIFFWFFLHKVPNSNASMLQSCCEQKQNTIVWCARGRMCVLQFPRAKLNEWRIWCVKRTTVQN